MTAKISLKALQEGNARFVTGKSIHPNADHDRLKLTAEKGQHPFVTILSCSDSRAPLEIIFDQGVGDIFAVRVAGNVCGINEIASIEYGVEHLATPLLVVLGHTQCGAVKAATTGAKAHGNIAALMEKIRPAVKTAAKSHPDLKGDELVTFAIEANIWKSIADLFIKSEIILESVQNGKCIILGAIYDISTGKVNWLGKHSDECKLLKR